MQQSLIQILFNRIVTQTSIKIVYVVKQSDDELSGRGRELQKFISQCFGQQNQDFTQITLLLNSYMGDLEDEELASSVRLQLQEIYEKPNEKIIVVRKIKSDQELKEYFSKAKRDELWKSIETSYTIKFKPAQFQRHGEIATFINSRCFSFTNKLVSEICQSLDKQIEKLDKEKMKTLLFHFMEIGLLIEMDMNQNVYGWYEKLINISQQITELLGCQNNIKKEISTFLKIFKFLSQEEDIIETKVVLRENSELIKNQLITQEKTIRYKMTVIENEANARKDEPQMLEFLQILQSAMILKELQNKNELEKKRQERESQKNCIVF
ncbi:unnamed protein product [Paramecium sonneborni]|nr:unnamed protein product [Paramecium sonneborni]